MSTTYYLTTSTNVNFAIKFAEVPPPVSIGNKQQFPFMVTISADNDDVHTLQLYSQFSNSQPYQIPQNKWSHLVPEWRFMDTNGDYIQSIVTTDTPIYSGTEVIGVTGYAQFYYVDDMPSTIGHPVVLWATLPVSSIPLYSESENGTYDYPSYANSKIVACQPYFVNGMFPKELKITRNGIIPLSASTYWVNQNLPNIITINGDDYPEFGCSNEDALNILYNYPSSNELGISLGIVDRSIVTIPTSSQVWTTLDRDDAYFLTYDDKQFRIGGYIKNSVKPNVTSLGAYITAGVNVSMDTYRDTPFVWVSNPDNKILHKMVNPYIDKTVIDNITSWLDNSNQGFADQNLYTSTPFITQKTDLMSLTGFGGIYGMAVDPCYNVWCSDSEMDNLYKFDCTGTLVSTINLTSSNLIGCTPAGISLDSTNKLWVSLFDSASVLKFDAKTGEFLFAINPLGVQTYTSTGEDPTFKPTLVETDKDDNVWVSFTNTLCSTLQKYTTDGAPLVTIILPSHSNPMDIVIDRSNYVWVTLTSHAVPPYSGSVNKYDSLGNFILSAVAVHPEYITIDNDDNIWFTQNNNTVTKMSSIGSIITNLTIGASATQTYSGLLQPNSLEGIASDSANRVWVLNAIDSKAYLLSGTSVIESFAFPQVTSTWYIDSDLNIQTQTPVIPKSIQAFGDWTGSRWFQKYSLLNTYLTGQSSEFNIDSFDGYDIRKFNESFDITTQMRNYALPEYFNKNTVLFEDYIGTMVGGLETSAHSMGRQIYERIANFVKNHSDVDTCNIRNLYSIASELDVPIDDYQFGTPSDLKRILDIVSIGHKQLWGDHCKCAHNFKINTYGYCENCGHKHSTNRGEPVNSDTYILSADIPILAEYKFDRDYYEMITAVSTPDMYITSAFNVLTGITVASSFNLLSCFTVPSGADTYVHFDVVDSFNISAQFVNNPSTNYPYILSAAGYSCATAPASVMNFYYASGGWTDLSQYRTSGYIYTNPYPVSAQLVTLSTWSPDDYLLINGSVYNRVNCPNVSNNVVAGTILGTLSSNGTISLDMADREQGYIGIHNSTANQPWLQWNRLEPFTLPILSSYKTNFTNTITYLSSLTIATTATSCIYVPSSINVASGIYIPSSIEVLIAPSVSAFSLYSYVSNYLLYDPSDYCYYEYIPAICGVQNEGIINWSDEYTTLDESLSTMEEWYGNGQLIEKMINYTLHKGCGF